jgi:hypothetical protein
MLAAVVAAEFRDEREHFICDRAQRLHGTWLRQIHEWPNV